MQISVYWSKQRNYKKQIDEKKNMKKWKWGNNDYDAFSSRELQVAFGNIVALGTLK